MTNKTLRMLIGDDVFRNNEDVCIDTMFLVLVGIGKETGKRVREGDFDEQGVYVCESPLPQFDRLEVKLVDNVHDVIKEGQNNNYDWIVSDLNYGEGYRTGGIEVIQKLKDIDAIKAIYTSETDPKHLEELRKLENLDYLVAPDLLDEKGLKTELLGKTIAKHYTK